MNMYFEKYNYEIFDHYKEKISNKMQEINYRYMREIMKTL